MSADQPHKTEREIWDDLVAEFDFEFLNYGRIIHNQGRILYEMKAHLKRNGLDKPRTGRWHNFLKEREIAESTAKGWVVEYQIKASIPPDKYFFPSETKRQAKIKIAQQNRKNNTAESAGNGIPDKVKIMFADDRDEENRDKNNRLVVECFFVITLQEKLELMEAIRKVGTLRATQLMVEGVLKGAANEEAANG